MPVGGKKDDVTLPNENISAYSKQVTAANIAGRSINHA